LNIGCGEGGGAVSEKGNPEGCTEIGEGVPPCFKTLGELSGKVEGDRIVGLESGSQAAASVPNNKINKPGYLFILFPSGKNHTAILYLRRAALQPRAKDSVITNIELPHH
jgi:hypothetical protein